MTKDPGKYRVPILRLSDVMSEEEQNDSNEKVNPAPTPQAAPPKARAVPDEPKPEAQKTREDEHLHNTGVAEPAASPNTPLEERVPEETHIPIQDATNSEPQAAPVTLPPHTPETPAVPITYVNDPEVEAAVSDNDSFGEDVPDIWEENAPTTNTAPAPPRQPAANTSAVLPRSPVEVTAPVPEAVGNVMDAGEVPDIWQPARSAAASYAPAEEQKDNTSTRENPADPDTTLDDFTLPEPEDPPLDAHDTTALPEATPDEPDEFQVPEPQVSFTPTDEPENKPVPLAAPPTGVATQDAETQETPEEEDATERRERVTPPSVSAIRTIHSDTEYVAKKQQTSVADMVSTTGDAGVTMRIAKQSRLTSSSYMLIGASIALLIGAVLIGSLFFITRSVMRHGASTTFFAAEQLEIYDATHKSREEVLDELVAYAVTLALPANQAAEVQLVETVELAQTGVAETVAVSPRSFLNRIEAHAPLSLTKGLSSDLMYGVHRAAENEPYLIFGAETGRACTQECFSGRVRSFPISAPSFLMFRGHLAT